MSNGSGKDNDANTSGDSLYKALDWYCSQPWYLRISLSILAVTATYLFFMWVG